jgi:shikimate kinase
MKNIVLVGFMGALKSVTSVILAEQMGMERVSTDDRIVEREGRSINDIFAQNGEAYFRDVESEITRTLSQEAGLVIDSGGGIVLRNGNMDALKKNGMIFYLKTSPEVIYDRVKSETHRPLLKTPDPLAVIRNLLDQRASCYAQADYVIETDGKTAEAVAGEIVRIIEKDTKTLRH